VAVFENLETINGSIEYIGLEGTLLMLAKSLEPTHVAEETSYRSHTKEETILSERDILGREILALGRDPTAEDVAACIPPIRRVKYWGTTMESPHTFVGSRDCVDTVPIFYNGITAAPRVNPGVIAPEIEPVVTTEKIWEGLVGGWLPIVRFVYPVSEKVSWETLTFAVVDPPTTLAQPAWYRFLKLEDNRITEEHYFDSFLPYPLTQEPDPARFYADLYKLHVYWEKTLAGAMILEVPERWIPDFCRHALVQEMITRVGVHPRYGVVDRAYGAPEHDGFQDILNSSVNGYLEWGLFENAKGYLENYFLHFVNPNGTIRYRGPEIGQYARMLTNIAQYYEYTGDANLLSRYHQKIEAIVDLLMNRRKQAKKLPLDDPAYGMIAGRHEADISFVTITAGTMNYEQPYISNSTETWRGFRDLGYVWSNLGEQSGDAQLTAKGQALINEAAQLREDVYRSIDRSILRDRDMPYLPLIAGSKEYHLDAPYRGRPESFDENRVWSEMMHSGMVRKETIDLILAYCASHYGMQMGIFTNREDVVAFQCYGEAFGLLQHDMIHEFLLFYYTHAFHLHTRGTWSAFECVDLDRDRAIFGPYCSPAQMTIPTITKWMMVFEDPLSHTLWLAKATPRSWLEPGKRIKVNDAPTQWGKIGYVINSDLDRNEVNATVFFPSQMPTETKVRLRAPEKWTLSSVKINGEAWSEFDPIEETIRIPAGKGGTVEIKAFYTQRKV
jgi:hypothetical protein